MLQRAKDYADVLDAAAMAFGTHPDGSIPTEICNLRELIELLEMIPEEAIRDAVYDTMGHDTKQTIADFRASGYPR